ncbi:hypothetical protein A2704_05035 [Candidatus Kaiserbacteria bacterium RIFCSPHIGHO2_01_FULL_54_36b]|uniref:SIS domain-containing protein n=1 Tax=Candidatus Kaiserbacteria bacterium RIFCSPHIGHO2_01_FULL_54_36b TaxID=1798483 RepID=A0A1F6CMZ9_9BACT|nr:MAG: hypothetical protein A2704_05035 [Candidatus Kaiserbacteria bacterium RIFCSPHIGHO2_01_FULL_54_36b]
MAQHAADTAKFVDDFIARVFECLKTLSREEVASASDLLMEAYQAGARIYVLGNGGSLSLATHWVADFNKTVFSPTLDPDRPRFRAIRVPTTEEELTAWGNDVGYDMVFAGPLANYLERGDVVIAISSSGNSPNVIKAVELAKARGNRVIGVSGFDGGELNKLADVKILVQTEKGEYEVVESAHATVLHILTKYFKGRFSQPQ